MEVKLQRDGASWIRGQAAELYLDGTGGRAWSLQAVAGRAALVIASVNSFKHVAAGTKLHERRPANDRWVFWHQADGHFAASRLLRSANPTGASG